MLKGLRLKKITSIAIYLSLLTGCTNNPSVDEILKSSSKGAVNIVLLDSAVYRKATTRKLDTVTASLLMSTLDKMAVLKRYEQEIGNGYTIEDTLTLGNVNDFCWINNFLLAHRKELPPNLDDTDTYRWIEAKQKRFKQAIDIKMDNKKMENDCRI
ncbi:hypothetical protein F907_01542 [Acinetobacter colistiniresistens]|uniref:Lipoprotein n=1 Tax=Acinetobacter colistiniresistens TaxID=280145 RepID=S3UDJ0_9GAMM|nr:hypothetical protein [Acinetobacter colistiniresistens]EPG37572.1 hypothetical protein F907_01542 [Acinetobacter colistiniresistens]TVT87039.1 hypothetical protein FPV60_02215 [Acinetobacter colistiniresistens]